MQDGAEEYGPGNSETCSATKKFLTEGLGCVSQRLRLNCKCPLFCLQIQLESHTGKQKHAAGEYHGETVTKKIYTGSQFSMEAKIAFSNGFLVQLLTHKRRICLVMNTL